jgi:hypothetical protein
MHNATNTVNVGVTNDAATTPVFFILGSAEINTKVSSANLSLFLLLVFYQQQDSQMNCCTNISYTAN